MNLSYLLLRITSGVCLVSSHTVRLKNVVKSGLHLYYWLLLILCVTIKYVLIKDSTLNGEEIEWKIAVLLPFWCRCSSMGDGNYRCSSRVAA